MPIRLLPTMAKNDHDYPATRILANGHTLVIASEGNNRIGMDQSISDRLLDSNTPLSRRNGSVQLWGNIANSLDFPQCIQVVIEPTFFQ